MIYSSRQKVDPYELYSFPQSQGFQSFPFKSGFQLGFRVNNKE